MLHIRSLLKIGLIVTCIMKHLSVFDAAHAAIQWVSFEMQYEELKR